MESLLDFCYILNLAYGIERNVSYFYPFKLIKLIEQIDFYSLFQSCFCWQVLGGQSPGAAHDLQVKPKRGGIQSIMLYFKSDILKME